MFRFTPLARTFTVFALLWGGNQTMAQSVWTARDSNTESSIGGVTYGGGQFVAVGDPGTVLTSPDGETWTVRDPGTTDSLRGIAYGNGLFVATGTGGLILTSPDGITWTSRDGRTTKNLSGVTYGNGRFVAVGGSGTVRYSTDGVTWELGLSGTTAALQGVGFGAGKFVAGGSSGTIIHSNDGQIWTAASSGTFSFDYFFSATGLNGTHVAVGSNGAILRSTDGGATWTRPAPVDTPAFTRLRSVTHDGNRFIAVGDPLDEDGEPGKVLISADGANWTVTDVPSDAFFNGIALGAQTFVIVGSETGNPAEGLILSSPLDLPPSLSFADWQQAEFTAAELADPLISGPEADPDCNGVPNFVEYALGQSPKDPTNTTAAPKIEHSPGGGAVLTLMRPADRVGAVAYSICYSADLTQWFPLGATEQVESEAAGIQTVTFSDPASSEARRFYKLVVTEL